MKLPLLLFALVVCAMQLASAQPYGSPAPPTGPLTCVVCAKPITGKYFVHNQTNHICADCEKLPTHCSVCRLPVKDDYTKTADGRLICKRDLPNVVLAEEDGRKLFTQARADLRELSDGALELRSTQVNVQMLFNLDFADSRNTTNSGGAMHRLGFSLSRPQGDGFAHNVVLLSGQTRTATLSTSAHEFGHLWLTENLKPARKLDPDTREALCELFAFKLAARRNDTNETARIKANPYTKGVILNALEFEARESLLGVVRWVRDGTEEKLPAATGITAAVAATPTPEPLRELRPPPPPATKLELRSLLRTSKRTVAVINGERFERGSELSMLIDGKRHLVRMEEAQENAVVVSVDGVKQTLRLGAK
ncbi:MAG: Uncharacterized protein FD161_3657 [Limisphaerales bacterium]|nr:MAG: Uncharacterized protein FD161_3657 [Limisphaerales bacterium]TXT45885.1 MAG: Uncharacterized protein FD140_4605 [Limisphaerales bacterium]